jgi:DNA-binding MarR family transcriptional regulator
VRFVRSFGLHRPDRTPCGFEAGVAEAHALSELEPAALRQVELVGRLGLTKSAVSRLVGGLVARGWVTRDVASDDGRGVKLTLTVAGRDAARRLRAARTARLRALLEAVPEDRRSGVLEVLELLEQAAQASDPAHA